jgi:hypothetical protein
MKIRVCLCCSRNRHSECHAHEFDQFEPSLFDACACPCQAEVKPGDKLIDLVKELRSQLEAERAAVSNLSKSVYEAGRIEGKFERAIKNFVDEYIDDEGDLLSISRNRRWQNGIEKMVDRYHKILESIDPEAEEDEDEDE